MIVILKVDKLVAVNKTISTINSGVKHLVRHEDEPGTKKRKQIMKTNLTKWFQ